MANSYLKGARNYHIVEEGEKVTKCGFKFKEAGREDQLETTKSEAWGNCPVCAETLPDAVKKRLHGK